MRRQGVAVALALVLWIGLGRQAAGYSGVGLAALEASGLVPADETALEQELDELKAKIAADDPSPATSYRAALLHLNRPKGSNLDDARAWLARTVLLDPTYQDALEIWADLNPTSSELGQLEPLFAELAKGAEPSPALLWAYARLLHLRGEGRQALQWLARVESEAPPYRSRANWLRAVIAGEDKEHEQSTKHFEETLVGLDAAASDLMWRSCALVASREEARRWEGLAEEDRADFFRAFWKRRDVFPLTDSNERLAEHFQRLKKARSDYALASNGRAYLTMHDGFKALSPDLRYYASDLMFDYQSAMGPWLDHRGLVYVRHGDPDRQVRSTKNVRAETWLYYRWTAQPLLFHFVDRRGVGEHVVALNLAQATATGGIEDDPENVINRSSDFRELYQSRATFHAVFQRVAQAMTRTTVEELLVQEASIMAGVLKEAWTDDTSNLIGKDNLLPFAAYSANFRRDKELVDTNVYYAVPEYELRDEGPVYEFDATIVIYDADWKERLTTAEHHFRYERAAGAKPAKDDLLVGVLEVNGLEPGRYNFAFQLRERHSDKIGVAKGKMVVDYYGGTWVDVSDLLLAQEVSPVSHTTLFERNGHRIVPVPTRTIKKGRQGKFYFEIYDLEAAADGQNHYRLEYRVLEIQAKPSIASKLFGIGMNVAYLFFPYQVFLAQAGMFGLDVATANPEEGLETFVEERHTAATDAVISEVFELDTSKYKPGIYQVYVTVKDEVSGSLSTRKLRFAIN